MSETIKGAVIGAIITGVIGIIGTVIAAGMAKNQGEQETINQLNSQMANVSGDNNTVTINSVDDLINEYSALTSENKSLVSQNTKYYDELEEAKSKIEEYENNSNSKVQELEQQLNDKPDIEFMDYALSIDGNDIPINKNKSMAIIDGREYVTKELAEEFLDEDQNITIKDDTLFVGKVMDDKANLFDKHVHSILFSDILNTAKDAFGNSHSNVLYFNGEQYHKIIFALNKKYSLLKMKFVPSENAKIDNYGNLIIYADKDPVRSFDNLNKESIPFEDEIPINNCTLLTIEYNSGFNNDFLIYDAIVYN